MKNIDCIQFTRLRNGHTRCMVTFDDNSHEYIIGYKNLPQYALDFMHDKSTEIIPCANTVFCKKGE